MKLRAEIYSYWTFDADLAGAMAGWPEFISGSGYFVELQREGTVEAVSVRLEQAEGDKWLSIYSVSTGELFERAMGRIAIEMAKNSEIHVRAVDQEA